MPLLKNITPQSWMDDIQFVLGTFLRAESQEEKETFVKDYLSARYEARRVLIASDSLRAAYNWITKNWSFLEDVGLRTKEGIVNCTLFALYNEIFKTPGPICWQTIPNLDPMIIVREAQKFIDAEKKKKA